MTPWLLTPSTFRTLRAAVLPPVLTTTAVLSAYGITAAYVISPGSGIRPAHGDRTVSYSVQPPPATATQASPGTAAAGPPSSVTPAGTAALGRPVPAPPPQPAAPLSLSSPSSPPSQPSADPSRPGNWAGEGRVQPGETDTEPGEDEGDGAYTDPAETAPDEEDATTTTEPDVQDSSADAEASLGAAVPPGTLPAPSQTSAQASALPARQAAAPRPVVEVLPLGSGLMLIGLGMAIALFGLRLRRE
ncbi:hypothetical protein [Streptomyces sp. NPDC052036]|uniref:hypothetical protein n=1 Tax=unclassified Streptomyces TaxID=2593676 RepID=UPI00343AC3B9